MPPIATLDYTNGDSIVAEPLTPEAFKEFGGVISTRHQLKSSNVTSANYGTAQKIFQITPVINNYANSSSGRVPNTGNFNMFRCSPPPSLQRSKTGKTIYFSKVLERHPYSTQTFLPMGRPQSEVAYAVIVAKNDIGTKDKLPDLSSVRAFVANGDQAVTYGPGTWHAPMVALGETVDFGVFIHENGIPNEDCQETYIYPGMTIEMGLASNCSSRRSRL